MRIRIALRLVVQSLAIIGLCNSCLAGEGKASDEIRIGQTLPYSGPLSGFGAIGHAEEAFFKKLNESGGINGHKIRLISLDDAFSPPKTVEQTRKLVEQDEVLFMFNSLGTATNSAVHRYLNSKKVPQLFVLSGATKWADPKNFPWTLPGMAAYETEGEIYAKYVVSHQPSTKIAILSQNDDFGRDYVAGFERGLGPAAANMIVARATYETSEPTINSQLAKLKSSGANVLFGVTLGKFTSQLIKGAAELAWKPDLMFVPSSSSSLAFLEPAGLGNAVGLITSAYLKDVNDAQWAKNADVREYFAFMQKYLPGADARNTNYAMGYVNANLMALVLSACGNDLSRESVLRHATSLHMVRLPLFLPGVTISTTPDDYLPFQQLQLRRFDGLNWTPFGELTDD